MFSGRVRGGKGYATEQKIRELKKLIFQTKRNAVENMNCANSQKYGYAPNAIEEKAVVSKRFRGIYDFYRLVKVK